MQNGNLYEQDGEELKLIEKQISPLDAFTLIQEIEEERDNRPPAASRLHNFDGPALSKEEPSYGDRLSIGFSMMCGGVVE